MVQKETQEHNGRFKHLYLFFILCFFLSARYIKKRFLFALYIIKQDVFKYKYLQVYTV